MNEFIKFTLSNFTLTFFVIGLFFSWLSLRFKSKPRSKAVVVEALFSYFLFFSIGCGFLYNFVMHVFFGEMAAIFIGWAQSPFQAEVGFASLGFAVLGLIAFWGNWSLKLQQS